MKTIPNTLLEFLLSIDVESCFVADMFNITLPSGQIILATDGQMPITYDGNVYQPATFGAWKISKVHTALGMTQSTCDFTLQAGVDTILEPFGIPILEAIQLGLFDAAIITIYRTYGLTYGETDFGVEIKYSGQITEFSKTGRTMAEGTAEAYTFALNQQMPRQTLQPGCRWTLYDPDSCTVNKASFTYAGVVGSPTTNITITSSLAITPPAGIELAQGTITFTSGQNSGLSMSIQAFNGTTIRLTRPFLFPVAIGDAFTVSAGCAHTFANCQLFQPSTSYQNFGGAVSIPNQEAAI